MEYVQVSDEEIEALQKQQQRQQQQEKEERERQEQKTKLYSYIRWSSAKQTGNTSNDRQSALADTIAQKHDLDFVKTYKDEGVSAFKSKNSDKGALSAFIQAVESGHIPQGSWLLVENLDRLSRDDITEAQALFLRLINLHINIVTGFDGKVLSKKLLDANSFMIIEVIITFVRANEESATKSKRTRGNALSLIKKHHENGERSPEGYARTIQSVGSNVWWVDDSSGFVEPHKTYEPIAKEILQMYLQGYGAKRITNYLNEKYMAPKTTAKVRKWSDTYTKKLIKNPAVIGEKTFNIDGVEYTLKDYYPPIATQDTWNRIQYKRKHRATRGSKSSQVALLSCIGVFKCGYCGSSFSFTNKKSARYVCGGGNIGATDCNAWGFLAEWVEKVVLRIACDKIWQNEITVDSKIPELQAQLGSVDYSKSSHNRRMKANRIMLAKRQANFS